MTDMEDLDAIVIGAGARRLSSAARLAYTDGFNEERFVGVVAAFEVRPPMPSILFRIGKKGLALADGSWCFMPSRLIKQGAIMAHGIGATHHHGAPPQGELITADEWVRKYTKNKAVQGFFGMLGSVLSVSSEHLPAGAFVSEAGRATCAELCSQGSNA